MPTHAIYNAAIVGCGRIASDFDDDPLMKKSYGIASHAGGYSDNHNINLIAASDISSEKLNKFGKRWGVSNLHDDYKDLLKREKIDILSICTWNSTHLEILEEAVKNDVKAIFCEKPISNSLKSADKMLEIANNQGVVLLTNHSRRWDKLYQDISDYIKEGKLGDIQQASCYYTAGIANTCSHLFDVMRMLFGDVKNVCSWYKDDSNKDDPNMDGYLKFHNGVAVTLQSLDVKYYTLFEIDIYGTKGRLRIQDNGFQVSYWKAKESNKYLGYNELFEEDIPVRISQKTIMKNAVQNIVDCLSLKDLPACTGEDGVRSLEIICAFHLSARKNNTTVSLPLNKRNLIIKSK